MKNSSGRLHEAHVRYHPIVAEIWHRSSPPHPPPKESGNGCTYIPGQAVLARGCFSLPAVAFALPTGMQNIRTHMATAVSTLTPSPPPPIPHLQRFQVSVPWVRQVPPVQVRPQSPRREVPHVPPHVDGAQPGDYDRARPHYGLVPPALLLRARDGERRLHARLGVPRGRPGAVRVPDAGQLGRQAGVCDGWGCDVRCVKVKMRVT